MKKNTSRELAFKKKVQQLISDQEKLLRKKNVPAKKTNGVFQRYINSVLTAGHAPITWRYDLNSETNPFLMERIGVNGAFNSGAIEFKGKILLAVRVEGVDRKSFFAIAESKNGVDNFRFWEYPILLPETSDPDINVYDMRLVKHEDGWIYGLFCTERKDTSVARTDTSSAIAQCGIMRTKDFIHWDRLPDLITKSPQQRNVVLHPEFVNGKYAFYTRPQDGFIEAGSGGGIGWGLSESINPAKIDSEIIIDDRQYHTIKEVKNGLGPHQLKRKRDGSNSLMAFGIQQPACVTSFIYFLPT